MKKIKFITIDIEGDIASSICREHFTEDTLYRDPNSIIWLCSFFNGRTHKSMGIRLPTRPRKFLSPRTGEIVSTVNGWHFGDNKFNYGVEDFGSSENVSDYTNFLYEIASVINYCYHNKIIIFFKGFTMNGKSDEYDKEQIDTLMERYGIDCRTECMIDINKKTQNFYLAPTHQQKGQRTTNQQYMDNGILHNMEDSKKLFEAINKLIK